MVQVASVPANHRPVLDIRHIRENPHPIRQELAKRGAADQVRRLEETVRKDREWPDGP